MSNSGDNGSTSSNNNNNRVEPRFFGSPSLYQPQQKNDSSSKSKSVMPPPGSGENPYWIPEDQPPPPYTQSPSESSHPSAPPLEEEAGVDNRDYSIGNTGGFVRPPPLQQQPSSPHSQQSYPRYSQYGAMSPHHSYARNNSNNSTGDVVSWPWNAPPSATGQALLIYPSPPEQPLQPKREKSCFEKSFKYFFYFLILCVIFRLLGLINGFFSYSGYCGRGVSWEALPKQFTYEDTLIVRVASGSLTSGHVTLKKLTDEMITSESLGNYGLVRTNSHVSPASLVDDPELTYTLTNWVNGTVLEIFIPEDVGRGRTCINIDFVIYVPENANTISVEVHNSRIEVLDETIQAEQFLLQTTNRAIDFYPQWSGKELVLATKNAHIGFSRPIQVTNDIVLSTSNGFIRTRETVQAGQTAVFATTNAPVDVDKSLEAPTLQIVSTNGALTVKDMVATHSQLKTTNARIDVEHAHIEALLSVQSSNGQVNVKVDRGLVKGEAVVRTTNAKAQLLMPGDYEGSFEMSTSSHNRVRMIDNRGWSHVNIKDSHVTGVRYSPDNQNRDDNKVITKVITTNAEASLEFADS